MSDPLRRLEDMPIDEQIKVLREIKEFLTQLIYTDILPKQDLAQQIETLKVLDRVERIGPESTPTNDDPTMLADVMSEVDEVLR